MKLSTKTLGCISFINILLFFVPAYSANLTVETNVYIEYSCPEYIINNRHIKMMKEIGARQWAAQNETAMKIDYTIDALNSLKNQNYDEAIENCIKGLQYANYSNNSEKRIAKYYQYIGFSYLKKDDLVHSITNYNISINKYKNNDPIIFYERGLARYKINDFKGAIEDYNKSIDFGLNSAETLANGDKIVNYKEEILNNKDLYTKDNNFNILDYYIMPVMTNYGKLVFLGKNCKKGEYERIYDYYTKMINNKTSKLAEVYNNRGVYYLEQNFYNKAIDDFQNAIKIAPQQKETYFNLALVYYSMENYKEAKKNLDNYFELCKNNQNNSIVGNYGSTKFEDNNSKNTFISQILKANIDLKLGKINETFSIYDIYKTNKFSEVLSSNKLPMDYLPLLEGNAYQFISTRKFKQAKKYLFNLLTAYYDNYDGIGKTRGKYFYYFPQDDFDIDKKYNTIENSYIFANIAIIEYLAKNNKSALEYINIAKELAFKTNEIDLYKNMINIYNFINNYQAPINYPNKNKSNDYTNTINPKTISF